MTDWSESYVQTLKLLEGSRDAMTAQQFHRADALIKEAQARLQELRLWVIGRK